MSDDPFAEPGDTEATVIRPRPRGQAPSVGVARAEPPAKAPPKPVAASLPTVGPNPLIAAAAPLLSAAVRVASGRGRNPDPEQLRRAMVDGVREFERRGLASGLDTRSLRAARYALCSTLDDIVLGTPWGAASSWGAQTLLSIFHGEVAGGERFFEILKQMEDDLGHHLDVVELMYLCMALGFEGRYRVMPRGVAALAELRDSVYRTIRQRRGDIERDLSPHWRGIPARHRPLAHRVPFWAMGLATLAALCLVYLVLNLSLAGASDLAVGQLAGLPPQGPVTMGHRPVVATAATPAPAAPAPAAEPTAVVSALHKFLEPEIKQGLVTVLEDPQATTVRIANKGMFGSGSATLSDSVVPLLNRIGDALKEEPGAVTVNGYTDNQPIRTPRFPSNFELSQARAEAAATPIASRLPDAGRVKAVGRGDADPLAPNDTPDGRQQNRRTEIVLLHEAKAP